jgi:outer membrane immunogenic protein
MNKWIVSRLLGGVSVAALNYSAFAADMAVKAPPPAPTPTYSWTGFYGGLHVGVGWPQHPDAAVTMQPLFGTTNAPAAFNALSDLFPFGGLQIGYNWQFQPQWVVGLEFDFSASKHSEGGAGLTMLNLGGTPDTLTDTVSSTRGLDWFGTVRGRVGYLVFPSLLAYGTGGLVYGHTRNDFTQAIVLTGTGGNFTIVNGTRDGSTGWTAGGGFEWALDRKWSVKLEYDYLNFDDAVASMTIASFHPGKGTTDVAFNVHSPDNSVHTIQIGLNYHFWN